MKKTLLIFGAALTALMFGLSGCRHGENKSVVKVGILHSLTGPLAQSEIPVSQAERMAVDEINKAGGVLGKQIELVIEDGESNPKTFEEKAKKLVTEDKVKTIFGCWSSAARKRVKTVVENEEVFALLWYPLQYEGLEASPNIMYTGAAPNQQVVPAVEYAENNFGKKVFIVGSDYVFPRTVGKIARAQLASLGGQCVGEHYVELDCTDFSKTIGQIKNAAPDWILNALNGDSNAAFFKQLKEAGINAQEVPVMSLSLSESEAGFIGAENLEGHYAVWNYFQSVDSEKSRAFVSRYKSIYGEDSVIGCPMEAGYIAVYLWAEACNKAGTFDVEEVRIAAKGLNFDAPEGKVTLDGENQHLYKHVRIGRFNESGMIDEIWLSERAVKPDPYLSTYLWARGL